MPAFLGPPLGQLVSFGSSAEPATPGDRLILSGTGSPVSAHADNEPPQWTISTITARETVAGRLFPVSKSGMARRPCSTGEFSWTYWLQVTDALNQNDSWADLESRLAQMSAWYKGTYTYTTKGSSTSYANFSGPYGDLIGLDANGAPRYALAQWVSFPDDIPLGQVTFYQCRLVFRVFAQNDGSVWRNAPALWDRGYRWDTGVTWD